MRASCPLSGEAWTGGHSALCCRRRPEFIRTAGTREIVLTCMIRAYAG